MISGASSPRRPAYGSSTAPVRACDHGPLSGSTSNDQRGGLLQTINPRGSATAAIPPPEHPLRDDLPHDGLGRVTSTTQWGRNREPNENDAGPKKNYATAQIVRTVTTYANGLASTLLTIAPVRLISANEHSPSSQALGGHGTPTTQTTSLRMVTDADGVRSYLIYDEVAARPAR